jgi:hypothetical protein
MFDSLSDQIRHDEEAATSGRERTVRYIVIAVISVLLFVGLYMVVRLAS